MAQIHSMKEERVQKEEVERRLQTVESQIAIAKQKIKTLQHALHDQGEKVLEGCQPRVYVKDNIMFVTIYS